MDFDKVLDKINEKGEEKRNSLSEERRKKQNEYAEVFKKVEELIPDIEGYIRIYKSLKGNNLIDDKFLERHSGINNSIVIKGGSNQDSVGYYTKGNQKRMMYIGICLNKVIDDGHDIVMKPFYFCMDSYGDQHFLELSEHPYGMFEVDSLIPKDVDKIELRIQLMKKFIKGFDKFKRSMKRCMKELEIVVD